MSSNQPSPPVATGNKLPVLDLAKRERRKLQEGHPEARKPKRKKQGNPDGDLPISISPLPGRSCRGHRPRMRSPAAGPPRLRKRRRPVGPLEAESQTCFMGPGDVSKSLCPGVPAKPWLGNVEDTGQRGNPPRGVASHSKGGP